MGKRKKSRKRVDVSADEEDLSHNPFASALQGMEREAAPEPEPEDADDADPIPSRAVVRKERKGRGGKDVTLIQHLDLPSDVLERWCKDLRKSLGCGGTVEGDQIALQGDQRDRVERILEKRGVKKISVS